LAENGPAIFVQEGGRIMIFGRQRTTLALAVFCAASISSSAQAQFVREEVLSFDSMNITLAETFNGTKGPKVTLAGLLRLANPGPNQPVVVIMHGIGGMNGARGPGDEWSNYLNQNGISTFFVDSYSGRGLNSPAEVSAKLPSLSRVPDAFAALEVLSKHPLIDPKKIVVMGLSHGSMAAIYSNLERFQKSYGTGLQFAAHVSIYGICNVLIQEDEGATSPILFLHGNADSWVNSEPCRDYAARLKKAGKDARMFEYEGADHGFDGPTVPVKKFPDVKTFSWCKLQENAGGLLNISTGKPLAPTDDCWKTGVGIGYQEAATKKAHEDALSFLKEVFK